MHLAKDKDGNIGRKIPSPGPQAKVEKPKIADDRMNLYVSHSSVVKQEAKDKMAEAKALAKEQALVVQKTVQRMAKQIEDKKKSKEVEQYQKASKVDPTMLALKNFYEKKQAEGETKTVLNALSPASLPSAPADFSSTGGNVQYVRGNPMTGGQQWRADFRTQLIVGNPLTRDGVFGPAITDYDRFVKGIDINERDVVKVAGNTILGRYASDDINLSGHTMGASFSDFASNLWSGVTSGVQTGTQEAVSKIPSQVSTAISSGLQDMINKGLARKNPDGSVTVIRETQSAPIVVQSGISPTMIAVGGAAFVSILAAILLMKKK